MRARAAYFLRDEAGATAIEYGLIMALVFLAMVVAVTQFADTVIGVLDHVSTQVTGVAPGG